MTHRLILSWTRGDTARRCFFVTLDVTPSTGMGMAKPLTELALQNLKPGATRREVPDGKVAGLYFVIQPSGSTSWALRYRHLGKTCKLTIGGGVISLKVARELARTALVTVAKGESPAA